MNENRVLCGRDVRIIIDGRPLLQAEQAELRITRELHRVRSCFYNEDMARIEGRREYKLHLTGIRFCRPFENCNFYDMDHFTVGLHIDGSAIILEDCWWDDFRTAADKERFREHITIAALRMKTEEEA